MRFRSVVWLTFVPIVLAIAVARVWFYGAPAKSLELNADALSAHNQFFASHPDFSVVEQYFVDIAKREGGAQAFQVLKKATFSGPIDTHEIGHTIGNILYQQTGLNGMRYCDETADFACAHSIVINALIDDGPVVFDVIHDVCASIGDPGSYDFCFHGFGHDVLAYAEFNLPNAIKLCGLVGTAANGYWESQECIGGVVMEMRGGPHDPELWAVYGKPYLDPENPLVLCQASYMPPEYRRMCYVYSTPFIFDHVLPDGVWPPTHFADALAWCEEIENLDERSGCYAGFGMQFQNIALGGDSRNRRHLTAAQADVVHQWCGESPTEDGYLDCIELAVLTVYQAGGMGQTGALTLCGQSPTATVADRRYGSLFNAARTFYEPGAYSVALCGAVPTEQFAACNRVFDHSFDTRYESQ